MLEGREERRKWRSRGSGEATGRKGERERENMGQEDREASGRKGEEEEWEREDGRRLVGGKRD